MDDQRDERENRENGARDGHRARAARRGLNGGDRYGDHQQRLERFQAAAPPHARPGHSEVRLVMAHDVSERDAEMVDQGDAEHVRPSLSGSWRWPNPVRDRGARASPNQSP